MMLLRSVDKKRLCAVALLTVIEFVRDFTAFALDPFAHTLCAVFHLAFLVFGSVLFDAVERHFFMVLPYIESFFHGNASLVDALAWPVGFFL
jgi:hypothetical protein